MCAFKSISDICDDIERTSTTESIYVEGNSNTWFIRCVSGGKENYNKEINLLGGSYPFYVNGTKIYKPKDYFLTKYTSKDIKGLKKPLFGSDVIKHQKYIVNAKSPNFALIINRGLIRDKNSKSKTYPPQYGNMKVHFKWDYIDPEPFYNSLKKANMQNKVDEIIFSKGDFVQILKIWIDQVTLDFYKIHKLEVDKAYGKIYGPAMLNGCILEKESPLFNSLKTFMRKGLNTIVSSYGFRRKNDADVIDIEVVE